MVKAFYQSRLSRARGSKHPIGGMVKAFYRRAFHGRVDRNHMHELGFNMLVGVAPFTGAWIETMSTATKWSTTARRAFHGRVDRNMCDNMHKLSLTGRAFHGRVDRNAHSLLAKNVSIRVAPFTGAWIETILPAIASYIDIVAPFTGAWIETTRRHVASKAFGSRLSRARGSKRRVAELGAIPVLSRLSRARGSKPHKFHSPEKSALCRAFHGRVDRNTLKQQIVVFRYGRAFHGRVDRNDKRATVADNGCEVAPFTGAWIETPEKSVLSFRAWQVAPFTGAWIETSDGVNRETKRRVAPFTGAWIETTWTRSGPMRISSRLSRARGSKHTGRMTARATSCRAFHGRVDRNSGAGRDLARRAESRLSRARGSKPLSVT